MFYSYFQIRVDKRSPHCNNKEKSKFWFSFIEHMARFVTLSSRNHIQLIQNVFRALNDLIAHRAWKQEFLVTLSPVLTRVAQRQSSFFRALEILNLDSVSDFLLLLYLSHMDLGSKSPIQPKAGTETELLFQSSWDSVGQSWSSTPGLGKGDPSEVVSGETQTLLAKAVLKTSKAELAHALLVNLQHRVVEDNNGN